MIFDIIDITNDIKRNFYINKIRRLIQDKKKIYSKGGDYLIYIDNLLLNAKKIEIYIGKSLVHDTYYNFIKINNNNNNSIYFNIYKGKEIKEIESCNSLDIYEIIESKENNDFYLEEELIKIYKRNENKSELSYIKLELLKDNRYSLVSTLDLKIIGVFESIKECENNYIRLENGIVNTNKFPSLIKEEVSNLFRVTIKFITEKYILDKEKILIFDRKYDLLLYNIEVIEEIITNKYNDNNSIGFIERIKCKIKKQN